MTSSPSSSLILCSLSSPPRCASAYTRSCDKTVLTLPSPRLSRPFEMRLRRHPCCPLSEHSLAFVLGHLAPSKKCVGEFESGRSVPILAAGESTILSCRQHLELDLDEPCHHRSAVSAGWLKFPFATPRSLSHRDHPLSSSRQYSLACHRRRPISDKCTSPASLAVPLRLFGSECNDAGRLTDAAASPLLPDCDA